MAVTGVVGVVGMAGVALEGGSETDMLEDVGELEGWVI